METGIDRLFRFVRVCSLRVVRSVWRGGLGSSGFRVGMDAVSLLHIFFSISVVYILSPNSVFILLLPALSKIFFQRMFPNNMVGMEAVPMLHIFFFFFTSFVYFP